MELVIFIWWIIFGFSMGLLGGVWVTNKKWSSNANKIQRIYYGGRLYKVSYDD